MAIAELVVKLVGDVSGFARSMSQVTKEVQKTSRSLQNAGSTFTKNFTLPLAGIGTAALVMAGNFQAAMSKVQAYGSITGDDLQKLEKQAMQLGATTQYSAREAADGMAEYAAAGFSASQISEVMAGTLDLAAAGNLKVADAARITATMMGQFGMEAGKAGYIADVLAKAANAGFISVEGLGEGMRYAGTVATLAGQNFEETSAALSILSERGIQAGDAGSDLSAGWANLLKPTKKVHQALEQIGMTINDLQTADGKLIPLNEMLQKFNDAGIKGEQIFQIFGKENAKSWASMLDKGAPALNELTAKLRESSGYAKEAAAILRDNLQGSFEQMKGAVETLGISIGMVLTPAARGAMSIIQQLAESAVSAVESFRGLNPNIQNAVLAFLGIVTIAGPVVLVLGKIGMAIAATMKSLAAAKTALVLFTSATGLGLIVIGVGLAVAAIVYFKDEIASAFNYVYQLVSDFVNEFVNVISGIGEAFYDAVSTIILYGSEFASRISEIIGAAFEVIVWMIGAAIGVDLLGIFDSGLNQISEIWNASMKAFGETWSYLWDNAGAIWNQFVGLLSQGCGEVIKIYDVMVNAIVKLWDWGMNLIRSAFATAMEAVLTGLGYAQDVIGIFSDEGSQAIGKLRQSIEELKKPVESSKDSLIDTKDAIKQLSVTTKDASKETAKLEVETKKVEKATTKVASAQDKATASTKKRTKEEIEAEKASKKAAKAAEDYAGDLEKLIQESGKYELALKKMADASVPASDKVSLLSDLYVEADKKLKTFNEANEAYKQLINGFATGANAPADHVIAITTAYENAKKALEDFKAKEEDLSKPKKGKGTTGSGLDGALKDLLGVDLGAEIGEQFADQIFESINGAFELLRNGGKSEDWGKLIGATVADSLAAAADSYLPGSGQIVQLFAPEIEGAIGSLVGGESAGTTARKAADKFFADAFNAKRLGIIVQGQMVEIRDLVFSGETLFGGNSVFAEIDSTFGNFLASLPGDVQEAFIGVGTAFEGLLENGSDISGQLAAVFANNIGGSLNNLQLLVESSGKSFEELKNIVVASFLEGELSFLQAQTSLNGIAKVAEKGIPDGIGYTVQAFENLKAAGVKGGRVSTDALRDMAYEAKELGITTIPQLMENLVKSGKFTQKEIEQVFASLKDNGIDSIEALTSATDEQLLGVLSQLQAQEFPFADAVDDARELTQAIKDMPKSKDITFNMKTNLDQNTKDAMKAGFIPSAPGVQTTPSAKGNVFSAGRVIPHAKGGVVDNFTAFSLGARGIGTMAERAPEAIMPLERLPDGRLGVLSATTKQGSGSGPVTINISAPYAMPGVAETIRREVQKIMDTKNRAPGIRR